MAGDEALLEIWVDAETRQYQHIQLSLGMHAGMIPRISTKFLDHCYTFPEPPLIFHAVTPTSYHVKYYSNTSVNDTKICKTIHPQNAHQKSQNHSITPDISKL